MHAWHWRVSVSAASASLTSAILIPITSLLSMSSYMSGSFEGIGVDSFVPGERVIGGGVLPARFDVRSAF